MFFERVYEKGLAHASYIVGCQSTKEAIIIDPKRDIDTYLEIADREKLKITHVTETHIHADFLSGSRELAAATGAKVYLSNEGGKEWQYQFDHIGLRDGDEIRVGNLILQVIHTPGHTPEHISFLLTDTPTSPEPSMIFTGDFIFVGDAGRPDLLEKAAGMEGTMITGAKQMFKSLKKFKLLPDYIQIWPAHGAGSACGKALGAVPNSTIGYEKLSNWALKIENEQEFIKVLLNGQPEPPRYFSEMKKRNKLGPKILGSTPFPKKLSYDTLDGILNNGHIIIDTRDKISYANGHFSGSLNIQDNNSFSTWAGWMLDYNRPFILVAPDDRINELTRALIRIGFDNVSGYINEYIDTKSKNYKIGTLNLITVEELRNNLSEYQVIDVRGYSEHKIASIPGAINIHAGELDMNLAKLNVNKKIAVHCESGDRSSIACSFLARKGLTEIYNLNSGINGWIEAGYPVEKGNILPSELSCS
jgi:hydroxyacylglutathione hydrolase